MVKLYLQYSIKKSLGLNLISMLLYILAFSIIYITCSEFICPFINNYTFYQETGSEYRYSLSEEIGERDSIVMESVEIKVFSSYTIDESKSAIIYENMQVCHALIAPLDLCLNNTWYTEKNLIKILKSQMLDSVYLPYHVAHNLKVNLDDELLISYSFIDDSYGHVSKNSKIKVAGIIKPYFAYGKINEYDDTIILFPSKELYDNLLRMDNVDYNYFSNNELPGDCDDSVIVKGDALILYKEYFRNSSFVISASYIVLSTIISLVIVIYIELSFVNKKSSDDYRIFSLLGTEQTQIIRMLNIFTLIKIAGASLMSALIVKSIYLNLFSWHYCSLSSYIPIVLLYSLVAISTTLIISPIVVKGEKKGGSHDIYRI